ncbi:hypothetical protein HMPREF1014_01359 [Bacillus sp. 7_6_55CFAA_CT2]|nr:hypothetical protein HMPREF1014_01359 [Bacillus sp. 7_6_55CFAA_CT2]EJQ11490.1 hypothetical protein IE1_01984 [Bacillus cereus BAG3O-2]EJQ25440.1 hypothetical protein IE7_03351 [Bacillus cereus BAG4O-1]
MFVSHLFGLYMYTSLNLPVNHDYKEQERV